MLLGHRGARAYTRVAENTPASFDLALQHGCRGFEFDVRRTACGRAVICHDAKAKGLTIAKVNCERLKHLPQLHEVLAAYRNRAFLDIELKVAGLESEVLVALGQNAPQRGYVVSSFIPEVINDLRLRSASVPLGWICDKKRLLDRWRDLPVEYVILHHSLITADLVEELHNAEKIVLAWTVNDKPTMRRLAKWKVDGIISDQTRRLVDAFN